MYLIIIVLVYWFMQSQTETVPTFFANINNMNSYQYTNTTSGGVLLSPSPPKSWRQPIL